MLVALTWRTAVYLAMEHTSADLHPTSIVQPDSQVDTGVVIGAFALVEGDVTIRENCVLSNHAIVRAGCDLERSVEVDSFAVIGGRPQMRGATAEFGRVRVGERTVIREGVTVHRPTRAQAVTAVGADCLLMAHSHVGHDSTVGNGVTLANNVMLAGHVHVGEGVFIGGGAGVHQFVRIGRSAMIGGNASISYDVPPFCIAADRNEIRGLNIIGMRRLKLPLASVMDVKECFHAVFSDHGNLRQRAADASRDGRLGITAEGRSFLEFFAVGTRGFAHARTRTR